MNSREIWAWIKSGQGKLVLAIAGIFMAAAYTWITPGGKEKAAEKVAVIQDLPQKTQDIVAEIKTDIPDAPATPDPKPKAPAMRAAANARTTPLPPTPPPAPTPAPALAPAEPLAIDLYTAQNGNKDQISPIYAPFGRLIQCKLITTLNSSKIQTPIIAIVTNDVFNPNGDAEPVIPAGCEIHGTAQMDRARERIASQNQWVVVWTDGTGRELQLNGVALCKDKMPEQNSWRINDLSAGLPGDVIKADNMAELKLFAATFINGLAQGLTDIDEQTTTGPGGIQTTTKNQVGSIKQGALLGLQEMMENYAKTIQQKIQQDGFFVQVPAGRSFYVYVTQTLDQGKASIAGNQIEADSLQPQQQTRTTPRIPRNTK